MDAFTLHFEYPCNLSHWSLRAAALHVYVCGVHIHRASVVVGTKFFAVMPRTCLGVEKPVGRVFRPRPAGGQRPAAVQEKRKLGTSALALW